MPTSSQFLAFVVASLLFIQVPGPSLLFTIGRGLTVRRREALLSVVGNAVGLLLQVVLVVAGLAALVEMSTLAYTVLKVAGAGYVIWLGIQAIRHRADARRDLESITDVPVTASWRSLRAGMIVGGTNPKTIIFFAAFLPQFTDAAAAAAPQLLALGVVFAVLAVASDSCWALAAGKARDWFARKPQRLDHVGAAGGAMMVGLGATLVLQGNTGSH